MSKYSHARFAFLKIRLILDMYVFLKRKIISKRIFFLQKLTKNIHAQRK